MLMVLCWHGPESNGLGVCVCVCVCVCLFAGLVSGFFLYAFHGNQWDVFFACVSCLVLFRFFIPPYR